MGSSEESKCMEEIRRSVIYHPSIWRDHFLAYTDDVTEITGAEKEQHEILKEKVKDLLAQTLNDLAVKIELIDAIQRLGIGYHFEEEIDESLRQIHDTYQMQSSKDEAKEENGDVRLLALRFRLLRNQGYRVPCVMFNKLIDEEGNFKESLKNDVEGMLSLYEASNYGINGEEILTKALEFSSSHLESFILQSKDSSSLSKRVSDALSLPIHKTPVRWGAKKFISIYEEDESHNEILLNFAKSDFNVVQRIHQRELHHITRWWEALDFANKLPFVRDRVVECYIWIMGVYFEPKYKSARIFLTKVISITSVIDDIYDVHGTLDELRRFTKTIQSWDINAVDEMPTYMRICHEVLLGIYAEMEDELMVQGESYRVQYAKGEIIKLAEAYMTEAEWCYSKHIPTMDEYMKVGTITGAYVMLGLSSLVGMKSTPITEQDFYLLSKVPLVLGASSQLGRLIDDIAGHGIEQKVTAVDCYMHENGCSKMEAFKELSKKMKEFWKDVIEGLLEPRVLSMPILERILNLARTLFIMYDGGDDGYSNSKTRIKDLVQVVLVEPVQASGPKRDSF